MTTGRANRKRPPSRRAEEMEGPQVEVERTGPPNRRRWTAQMIALLGKASDDDVAAKLRIPRYSVVQERRRRRIAAFRPRRKLEWTDRALALLGTASDREVAAEIGFDPTVVRRKRHVLGIPPFHPPPYPQVERNWLPREDRILGTLSDKVAAARIGCSRVLVSLRRRHLGIPAFGRAPLPFRWTRRWLSRLGKEPDNRLAGDMGVSRKIVAEKRAELGIPAVRDARKVALTPELRRLLRQPSAIVRRRTGLGETTISALRRRLGIPPPRRSSEALWTRKSIERLGKVRDGELARELGVGVSTVSRRRKKAGIPSWRPSRRPLQRKPRLAALERDRLATSLVPAKRRPTRRRKGPAGRRRRNRREVCH